MSLSKTIQKLSRFALAFTLVVVAIPATTAQAQIEFPQMKFPTLGGKQFWSDYFIHGGWRIQQNAISNSFRLLSPRSIRITSGSFEACQSAFRQVALAGDAPNMTDTVVLLIHGLGRSRQSMSGLAKHVEKKTGWTSMTMEYASTRRPISDHAHALESVIANLPAKRIHIVGHSLGNIVSRRYLSLKENQTTGKQGDKRLGHIVMLGPPNQGAAVARVLKKMKPFEWIAGDAAMELANDPDAFAARLAVPKVPFGIIAGSVFQTRGGNPLIPGPDDLVVGVEETKIPGAADFLVVPHSHTWIMDQIEVKKAVVSFLTTGKFKS